jgi:class 3 adenylate cyclase
LPSSIIARRRQLTVMFCDLIGSTARAARLGPDDLRAVVGAYHRCIAKYTGGAVLGYFAILSSVPKLRRSARAITSGQIGAATEFDTIR